MGSLISSNQEHLHRFQTSWFAWTRVASRSLKKHSHNSAFLIFFIMYYSSRQRGCPAVPPRYLLYLMGRETRGFFWGAMACWIEGRPLSCAESPGSQRCPGGGLRPASPCLRCCCFPVQGRSQGWMNSGIAVSKSERIPSQSQKSSFSTSMWLCK